MLEQSCVDENVRFLDCRNLVYYIEETFSWVCFPAFRADY